MSAPLEDRRLAERLVAGDEAAFETFFEHYFACVYRFALGRVHGHEAVAEEIAQATLCQGLRRVSTYRAEASLLTWLCTIARHEVGAWARRQSRAAQVELDEGQPQIRAALHDLAAQREWVAAQGARREHVAHRVHVTLDLLPEHYGDVLGWKYLEGASVEDIAVRLRVGLKAAESLLGRARRAFREAFFAPDDGGGYDDRRS